MAQLIDRLAESGARKTDGTVVASGSVYFYVPGSSTQATVYSDAEGLTSITQPVSLNAGGQARVFVKSRVRAEVYDSSNVAVRTYDVDDCTNSTNAAAVEIENAGFTGTNVSTGATEAGGRIDLNTALTRAHSSTGGVDFKYQEAGGDTARNLKDAIGWCVTPEDHGAQGDDATDDATALQEAINRAVAANKPLLLGPKTYRFSSGLTATGSGVAGLMILGSGRGVSVLKFTGTSGDVLTINLSSSVDSKIVLRDFTITANTTTSGDAIEITNGNRALIQNVSTALCRKGIDCSAVSETRIDHCVVESTDDHTAARGLHLGARSRVTDCEIICGTANGTGILTGAEDCRIKDNYVSGWATGISAASARTQVRDNDVVGATTGISVGAVASVSVTGNYLATNTTDISINASATLLVEHSNIYTTLTDATVIGNVWGNSRRWSRKSVRTSYSAALGTHTATVSSGATINQITLAAGSSGTLTMGATSTTGLADSDEMIVVISNRSGGAITLSWNAQLQMLDGTTSLANSIADLRTRHWHFVWNATDSKWRCLMQSAEF